LGAEPYRSARRVFWVLDSGSSHRGQAAVTRLAEACPRLVPVDASWLNQVEIDFSILERKVLTPADAVSHEELAARILAFQALRGPRPAVRVEIQQEPQHAPRALDGARGHATCRQREYITEYSCESTWGVCEVPDPGHLLLRQGL
jgi:hypothetical protein